MENCLEHALRPLVKGILRRTTGLCELQRICYDEPAGAPRVSKLEQSLSRSRNSEIKRLVQYLNRAADERIIRSPQTRTIICNSVHAIYQIKSIKPHVHQVFEKLSGDCIGAIWGYKQLFYEVEDLRKVAYDSNNPEHEAKLLQLWNLLMPNQLLNSRISECWKEIGFQGEDPKTDFRGMGLLGLENLLYFAQNYSNACLHVLSHSHHPKYGYSFAITGINLTHMAYILWKDGSAKTHVYNASQQPKSEIPSMKYFHQFYCYLFYEFDKLWLSEKPSNVMEFSRVRDMFEGRIRQMLANPHTIFKLNFHIDCI
nr:EOG090X0AMT [Cyclestheria hislopi]